jgi:hypothetical protein
VSERKEVRVNGGAVVVLVGFSALVAVGKPSVLEWSSKFATRGVFRGNMIPVRNQKSSVNIGCHRHNI